MKKQELLSKYNKLLKLENYSEQTIKSYYTALKLFLEYINKFHLKDINDKEIQYYF